MHEMKHCLVPWPEPDNLALPWTPLLYPSPGRPYSTHPPHSVDLVANNSGNFVKDFTVWGVEPGVTHHIAWLEGTSASSVQQYLAIEQECNLIQSRKTYSVRLA